MRMLFASVSPFRYLDVYKRQSYEMVEDEDELIAVSKVFEQMLDDVDLEM